jgi:NodT family efflux transporter outer membrane factor (OMF) lipoprotein
MIGARALGPRFRVAFAGTAGYLLRTALLDMCAYRKAQLSLRRGAAAGLAALLAACAVGPNFTTPKPPPVNGYSATPMPQTTAAANVHGGEAQRFVQGLDLSGEWWTLFHSPPLDAIVKRALAANPTLQAAQSTLQQARAQLLAGEGGLFPTVTGNASITREKLSGAEFGVTGVLPIFTVDSASLSVSYLLDVWGGTRRQIESLGAQAEYERFELEASYLTLTSNVATAAIAEAGLRGEIAATQEIIDIETQELAGLQRQFAIGAASNVAVLAQAAALAQSRAQLPPLQKQLAQTRDQLTAFLGRLPSEELTETFDLGSLQLPATLPVSLPSKLVEQRPDIRASESLLHEASAEVGVATANMLPQFTLNASYGNEGIGSPFGPGKSIWSLGAGLTQPLFEGGKLYYQRRAAIDALQTAAAQYRQTVVTAFQNVADALRALHSDADAVSAEAASVQAAAASLDSSRRQFHIGAISYLSLLTAEQTYQQARLSFVEAQASRFSDTVALFQALGGGWWHRQDVAEAAP